MGWDAPELFASGRYDFLETLIDHLPRTSAYAHAVAQDDEAAAELADIESQGGRWSPPLTEWSPEAELLAAIFDRLAELIGTEVAVAGGKPSRVQPYPRPVTAFDRVRARRRKQAADEMAAKLFPGRGDDGA